jgi:hypothetical protein
MRLRVSAPGWGRLPMLVAAVMCALSVPALAQPKKKPKKPPAPIEKPVDKPEKPEKEVPDTDNAANKDKEKPDATAAPAADTAAKSGKKIKEQTFNFEGLGLAGRNRSPQLLYFLERANEELERASLEKRSFIPHMVRSLEEEAL